MKQAYRYFIVMAILVAVIGCGGKSLNQATMPIDIREGNVYFSQVSLQYEKGRHLTTNYRKGTLLPINSQVQLDKITSDDIFVLILPEHRKLHIENVQKHTGDSTLEAFSKLFKKQPVNLSRFSPMERDHILLGKVAKGMSKKAVIAAIGYPPITETPSMQYNEWTYWSSRFNRFIVHFNNDRVSRIQD